MYEQTLVLLSPQTAFSVPCQACLERSPQLPVPVVQGTLRRYEDLGWMECPNGHRLRAIRAGRGVHAELTTPLW